MINKEMLEEFRANGIVTVSKDSKFANRLQYRGLTVNKDINKNVKTVKLQYTDKIGYDLEGEITDILMMRGKVVLVIANAGGGKTYTMMKCSSELAKNNPNTAFVLIVPNTTQSDQNETGEDLKQFGFTSIVGKKNNRRVSVDANKQLFSCVYDKAKETIEILKKAGKEVVLIVDEAHKLIWDTYRDCLNDVDEAMMSEFGADMVVMMTATPRTCLKYYRYDNIFELEDRNVKSNIKKLRPVYTRSWTITLLREINKAVNKGLKPLVRLNSKEEIKNMVKLLDDSGLICEVLTSDNKKDNEVFKSIETTGMIGNTANVLFCTSVIECGISLKATDILPIEVIRKARDFNKDNTIQFFARPRKQVKEGVLIIKQYDEDLDVDKKSILNLKDYDWYFNELSKIVDKQYSYVKAQLDYYLETKGFDYARKQLEVDMAVFNNNYTTINCIEADYDNLVVYINNKKFIQRVFSEMDKDIVIKSPLQLKKTFEGTIFYEGLELEVDEIYLNLKELVEYGIKPRLDLKDEVDCKILKILKNRNIKKHIHDIVCDIYNESLDMNMVKELKSHRLYSFIADNIKSINTTTYMKELRRENSSNRKLKLEDYRQLLNDENFVKAIPAIINKELTAENIADYNLEVSLHDIIDFRETKLFKTLTHVIKVFGNVDEAIELVNHRYINEKGDIVYISVNDIEDICEVKHFIEKIKKYVGVTKYDLIYDIILKHKKGRQVSLSKKLGVILITELVRAKHYNSREVMKLIREFEKEKDLYEFAGKEYEFYSKENIKKLELGISSQLKNKLLNDLNKIFVVGQDSKGYIVLNSLIKSFDIQKYLK